MPVDYKVFAFRGTVPLKKDASGSAVFALVGAPQIVFGIVSAALQNRVIHAGAGDENPALNIRVFGLQGGEIYKGGSLFFPSRYLPGGFSGEGLRVSFFQILRFSVGQPRLEHQEPEKPQKAHAQKADAKPFEKGFHYSAP